MNNIDTILAIIGVVVTIIIGIIGLKYTFRQQKNTQLTFMKNTCISLFKAIVKNLDDVEIKYQGKKIGENLILFKGTIFNNGNVDIDKSIIHKPLTLELPENYTWIKHKIIDTSDGLEININRIDNNLCFEWELLKEGEFFTFDSLIEYQSTEKHTDNEERDLRIDLIENITFNHRITNLKSVKKEKSVPKPISVIGLVFISAILLSIVSIGFYFSAGQFIFPRYEMYQEVSIDSTLELVKIKPINVQTIELINQNGDELTTLNLNDYSIQNTNKIIIKEKNINYIIFGISAFFGIAYLIMWIVLLIKEIEDRGLYKKLKTIADKYDSFELDDKMRDKLHLFSKRLN